jgi:hypothetical protein
MRGEKGQVNRSKEERISIVGKEWMKMKILEKGVEIFIFIQNLKLPISFI